MTQQFHFWDYILRMTKHQYKRIYASLCSQWCSVYSLKILFIYLFIYLLKEGKGGKKKGGETLICCLSHMPQPGTQACALTGNQTSDLLVCRMILNQLSHNGLGCSLHFYIRHPSTREGVFHCGFDLHFPYNE